MTARQLSTDEGWLAATHFHRTIEDRDDADINEFTSGNHEIRRSINLNRILRGSATTAEHPRFIELHDSVNRRLLKRDNGSPFDAGPFWIIDGPPMVGKSRLIQTIGFSYTRHVLDNIDCPERSEEESRPCPVTYLRLRDTTTPKAFAHSLRRFFYGVDIGRGESEAIIFDKVLAAIEQYQVRLVILEDLHHIRRISTSQTSVPNMIRSLMEDARCAVLAGTVGLNKLEGLGKDGKYHDDDAVQQLMERATVHRYEPYDLTRGRVTAPGGKPIPQGNGWAELVDRMICRFQPFGEWGPIPETLLVSLYEATGGIIGKLEPIIHEAVDAAFEATASTGPPDPITNALAAAARYHRRNGSMEGYRITQ